MLQKLAHAILTEMNWDLLLPIGQIITAVVLCVAILMQIQGTGLGGLFGSSDTSYHTKRGAEKFLFYASIFLSIAFMATSLITTVLQ